IGSGTKPALTLLFYALDSELPEIHDPAMEALAKIGKDAVPVLVEALRYGRLPSLRLRAALTLGRIGPDAKDATLALHASSTNRNEVAAVKAAARAALDSIARKQ